MLRVGALFAGVSQRWLQIRQAAAPHCPQAVAPHPRAPKSRSQAQAIGDACLAQMGPLQAAMGGRENIQEGIDTPFRAKSPCERTAPGG